MSQPLGEPPNPAFPSSLSWYNPVVTLAAFSIIVSDLMCRVIDFMVEQSRVPPVPEDAPARVGMDKGKRALLTRFLGHREE